MVTGPYYCYIIANQNNYTYNGFSNNLERRLRQHCGYLKGGAKYTTKRGGIWKYIVIIECIDSTYNEALSIEWSVRFPTNKKPRPKQFCNPEGRIRSLIHVFKNPKFADKNYIISVTPRYFNILSEMFKNIKNVQIESLSCFEDNDIIGY